MKWHDYRDYYGRRNAAIPGSLQVLPGVPSFQLGNRRDLLVWLPPGYDPARRLPVLYFQDGQNLFDPATSFGGHWALGETMAALAAAGKPAIAVGIPNAGQRRIQEYSPFVDRSYGGGLGDHYLHFLTDTVKPLVDRSFATRPEPETTGLVGASLGGIIALYGLNARPDVFGLCAALSPSCWFARQAMNRHLTKVKKATGRYYLDVGLAEGGRRRWTAIQAAGQTPGQKRFTNAVDRVATKLSKKGPLAGRDLLYLVDPRGEHNEHHWRRRLPIALRFLLRDLS